MSTMTGALIITGIGMGLVFVAILALWGMMELMVRVTARFSGKEENGENEESPEEAEMVEEAVPVVVDNLIELKRKAAAVAVAMALARAAEQPVYAQIPTYTSGSAWQAVSRGGQLSRSATLYNRKSRGK
jgi:Na+-transporting methylmalonyl-CoA/oxaloacetate decarboxylase gamma subunit